MSLLDVFLGETFGTMVLILLGNGVVANALYKRTVGTRGGVITLTLGWGFAVFIGALVANIWGTGAHLNPAVTVAKWIGGKDENINTSYALVYLVSEFIGAFIGQVIVVVFYWNHAQEEENRDVILSTHSTTPTHQDKVLGNVFSEVVATMVLLTVVLYLGTSIGIDSNPTIANLMNFIGPFSVGIAVFVIGVGLGGTTAYAINPFRDLVPRIVYQLAPYKNKPSANWSYSWVPVVGPMIASIVMGIILRFA